MESQLKVYITFIGGEEDNTHVLIQDHSGEVLANRHETYDHIYDALGAFEVQYMNYGYEVDYDEVERNAMKKLNIVLTATK